MYNDTYIIKTKHFNSDFCELFCIFLLTIFVSFFTTHITCKSIHNIDTCQIIRLIEKVIESQEKMEQRLNKRLDNMDKRLDNMNADNKEKFKDIESSLAKINYSIELLSIKLISS